MDAFSQLRKSLKALKIRWKNKSECQHLHYDILQDIFKFLDWETLGKCAQVCHYWKEAAYHPCLWKGCVFELPMNGWSDNLAQGLKERGISALSVRTEDRHSYDETREPDKTSRDSSLAEDRERTLSLMRQCCDVVQLRVLIHTGGLQWIMPPQFHSLTCLVLCNVELNEKGLQDMLSPLVNLVQLHINNQQKLDLKGQALYGRGIMSFNSLRVSFNTRPNLKDLEVVGMSFTYCFPVEVVPAAVDYRSLQRLSLIDAISLSEHFILQIAEKLPDLKHLVFGFYCNGHGMTYQPKFPALESIRVIDCEGQDSYSQLLSIFSDAPQLRAADFSIHYSQLKAIYRLGGPMVSCNHFGLHDNNITQLIANYPKLTMLNLSGNHGVTASGINHLLNGLPDLKVVVALKMKLDHTQLQLNSSNLKSFLAEMDPIYLNNLPNLRFRFNSSDFVQKRLTTSSNQQTKTNSAEWTRVASGSQSWYEAFGIDYFHSDDMNYVFTNDGRWDIKLRGQYMK